MTIDVHVVKEASATRAGQSSNVLPIDEELYTQGVVQPPTDPAWLAQVYGASSSVRPNVDAYATNIDGFAHSFEPVFDIESDAARDFIRNMLTLERIQSGELPMINDADIDAALFEAQSVMPTERLFIEAFFKTCCEEMTFKQLRERTRVDLESTGVAYWEVTRNSSGKISQLSHVQSHVMRITNADKRIEVTALRRTSDIGITRTCATRRFRRFVQLVGGNERVWFKEFGDPRVMSSCTGRFYSSVETLRETEPDAPPATEILYWSIYSPVSVYGAPRWMGALAAVLGTRESEEINVAYFTDKCIPPLAILVEDGTLAEGAVERIRDTVRKQIQGKENFHSMLIIEAKAQTMSDGAGGTRTTSPKIKIEPLSHFQQQDALFQTFEQNNAEKVGQQFRLPRLLRGLMADFNRATAEAALEYAETQVFQPLRIDFDTTIDRLMVELGVRYWRFRSGAPLVRNPVQLSEMLVAAVDASILVPREAREIASDVFGRKFDPITEEWVNEPTARLKGSEASKAVKELVNMRASLETTERELDAEAHRKAAQPVVVELDADEFRSLVTPH